MNKVLVIYENGDTTTYTTEKGAPWILRDLADELEKQGTEATPVVSVTILKKRRRG